MIKSIPIDFEDDFTPPEKFDGVEGRNSTGRCERCPFYWHDVHEAFEDCNILKEADDKCPIRQYF